MVASHMSVLQRPDPQGRFRVGTHRNAAEQAGDGAEKIERPSLFAVLEELLIQCGPPNDSYCCGKILWFARNWTS